MTEKLWTSPTIPWEQCSPERQELLYNAWSAGEIAWKLDPVQREAFDAVYASHATVKSSLERLYTLEFSRRGGKDQVMCTMAVSEGAKARKHIRIPYAAPTREACHDIVVPIILDLFRDCPPELLPYEIKKGTFRRSADELNWDTGGQIQLIGVDLHPERLRGTATHCAFMTEPGFMQDLEHLLQSILLPQLLTDPDGFIVCGSTPPVTPGHFWSTTVVPEAQLRGMHMKRTIYAFLPRLGQAQVDGMIKSMGGLNSTKVQRELMVEHILESENAVVPEFRDVKKETVTEEAFKTVPTHRDTYTVIDPGFAHATGALFGYMDFEAATFNIEGCFRTRGLNSNEVARRIKAREWQLWGRVPVKPSKYTAEAWAEELELIRSHFYPGISVPPAPVVTWNGNQPFLQTYRRVSDTDSRLIADMASEHGLNFFPTEKQDLELHTNALRLNIQRKRFRIHPRCVELIADLEQATWNKSRTKMAEGAGGHHYDTVSAMTYLNRNLLWNRNPFPPDTWDRHTHHIPKTATSEGTKRTLAGMFRRGRR